MSPHHHAATTFRRLAVTATAILLAIGAGPACADRPLVSETADVIGDGQCQIETGLAQLKSSGTPSAVALDALGSCGVAGIHQFGVSLSRVRQGGVADLSVGLVGKTTLKMPADGAIGYALAYGITSEKSVDHGPGHDIAAGNWHHGVTRLFGVATKELREGLLGHLNLGWMRTEQDRRNSTIWSLGLESDSGLRWAADVFGDDRTKPWISAGLLFPLADKVSANLAYAQQFERPRVRQLTLGFKFEL